MNQYIIQIDVQLRSVDQHLNQKLHFKLLKNVYSSLGTRYRCTVLRPQVRTLSNRNTFKFK